MKRWMQRISVLLGIMIPGIVSAATQIGVINVIQLSESSSFIKDANKKLQEDAQRMNVQLESQRNKVRQLIEQYNAAKTDAVKKSLDSPLKTESTILQNLKDTFQKKIHADEDAGRKHFNQLLHAATERVAKAKHINVILPEQSMLYNDGSLVNLTQDVAAELQKVTEEEARQG